MKEIARSVSVKWRGFSERIEVTVLSGNVGERLKGKGIVVK